jgi:hypothetical protein
MSEFDEIYKEFSKCLFFRRFEELEQLREGLIVSYGVRSLKSDLFYRFKEFIVYVEDVPLFPTDKKYKFGGAPTTLTILIKNPEQFAKRSEELQQVLNRQGYITIQHTKQNEFDLYQFEPKYPLSITKDELKQFRVFHITEEDRVEKILNKGLIPKETRTSYKHSGNRIYLFATLNPEKHIPILAKKLSLRATKKEEAKTKPMVALEVNKEGISNQELYLDESFQFNPSQYCAVFTLYPIRPSYLKIYEN